jgi:hypothetical protein
LPSDSDLQESVDRARQAFRATSEGHEYHVAREGEGPADKRSPSGLHPFFRGLLETLPDPGADWPRAQREQWLETARNIFALLYQDSEEQPPVPLQQDSPRMPFDHRVA